MGLMDKFKNLFTDEEIIDDDGSVDDTIEIKEIKKEEDTNKLPTFMREKIEKEEKKTLLKQFDNDYSEDDDVASSTGDGFEMPILDEKNTFKFPIEISESDFVETRSRQTIHKKRQEAEVSNEKEIIRPERKTKLSEPRVADLYKDKKTEKQDAKPKFRATPIISPIYGILDKNYTSGDIESFSGENFEERRHSKSVDFDSVRKKAYGSLTQEIKENLMCENCEYLKEAKECKREREQRASNEYSHELLNADCSSFKDVTLDEATENYYDYGVEYAKSSDIVQEENIKISNFADERPKNVVPPVKSSINLLSTLKKSMGDEIEPPKEENNLEMTADLFNLIDSMYDERNDDK